MVRWQCWLEKKIIQKNIQHIKRTFFYCIMDGERERVCERMIKSIDQSNWVLFVLFKYHDGFKWNREWHMNGLNFRSFTKLWLMAILCHFCQCFSPGYSTHCGCAFFYFYTTTTLITRSDTLSFSLILFLFEKLRRTIFFPGVYFFVCVVFGFYFLHSQSLMHCNVKRGKVKWYCMRVSFIGHCLSIHSQEKFPCIRTKETKSTDKTGHYGSKEKANEYTQTLYAVNKQSKCDRSRIKNKKQHDFYF